MSITVTFGSACSPVKLSNEYPVSANGCLTDTQIKRPIHLIEGEEGL
jgi:hypothetical protein